MEPERCRGFEFRALKVNLPFFSYRKAPSLQLHEDACRNPEYWTALLDMMARCRFNVLTLWSMHPFPYMIRSQRFPEACPFSEDEMSEWRALWSGIFGQARERGIETYLVTWNIFVSPAFAHAHDVARYSIEWEYIGEGDRSELVEAYNRECITQVIDEYPDLTGLGTTIGERMGGMTAAARRAWLDRVIFAGMRQASRPVKFLYRAPLSADTNSGGSTSVENERATRAHLERLDLPAPVYLEFKYNWSHGHSSPQLFMVHGGTLGDTYRNPPPTDYRIVWTVRNEDFFVLRWGQPEFIREFIANNDGEGVAGCIIGSEIFIPARDYVTKDGPHRTWRWAFERQWLFYALWGRLLEEPTTGDDAFAAMLDERFGAGRGADLLRAWSLVSRAPLRLASFHRATWDFTLYAEGFCEYRKDLQFFDIDAFIDHPVLDPQYVNIRDFVASGDRVEEGKTSPLDLAQRLMGDSEEAERILTTLRVSGSLTPALECELADIDAWIAYGRYFAQKLRGGVALARFRRDGDASDRDTAVAELRDGVGQWRRLMEAAARFNHAEFPFHTERSFSWARLLPAVERDVTTALNAAVSPPTAPA